MDNLFGSILVVITSIATYGITRRHAAESASVRHAFRIVLECLGASTVFLGINAALGTLVILGLRSFTPLFLSVYVLNDLMLIVLSILQGFVFHLWWRSQV